MKTIGFIGLGNMGAPMAHNLINDGYALTAFDIVADPVTTLVDAGATAGDDALAVARASEVVISMLPAGQHVRELFLGETGLLTAMAEGQLVIDCSTIDHESALAVAEAAAEQGVHFVDAPVSGGVKGAKAGTLSFMCGGSDLAFEEASPILASMGTNIFHAGPSGAGQIAKACNNMLLAIQMIGTSEALNLGASHGLDPKVLSEIMKQSSGGNWCLNVYNPYPGVMPEAPASNDYQGGFRVDLMEKDLSLAMQLALGEKSSVPLGALAHSLYRLHQGQGSGMLDFSSVLNLLRNDK